jgi:hypothetical protein
MPYFVYFQRVIGSVCKEDEERRLAIKPKISRLNPNHSKYSDFNYYGSKKPYLPKIIIAKPLQKRPKLFLWKKWFHSELFANRACTYLCHSFRKFRLLCQQTREASLI